VAYVLILCAMYLSKMYNAGEKLHWPHCALH